MWYYGESRSERTRAALAAEGLSAIVALTPENAAWLSGRTSTIAGFWRHPGLIVVGLGADGAMSVSSGDSETRAYPVEEFARFGHPFWIEHLDLRGIPAGPIAERIVAARPDGPVDRPAQFDFDAMVEAAADAIRAVSPDGGRVGLDLFWTPGWLVHRLLQALPDRALLDVSTLFDDLRAIKDADEIEHLRRAGELTDLGIAAARAATTPGITPTALTAAYQSAIWQAAANDPRYAALREAEGLVGVGDGTVPGTTTGPGQTIKLDMQVNVGGYHSDIGRTWAIDPTPEQQTVHDALLAALDLTVAAARPGVACRDLWAIGTVAMRSQGFTNYSRGHLGHSVGLGHNFEEPPFIAPGEERPLAPGMVISIELPYYLSGVGTFQMERMLLITDAGHETLDRLPFAFDASDRA